VRITARLVEAATEVHLWSDTYDHIVNDTLSVQTRVAGHVARAIVMELLPSCPPPDLEHLLIPEQPSCDLPKWSSSLPVSGASSS
jgi:hypothetical protein